MPAPEAVPVFDLPKHPRHPKLTVAVLQKLYTEVATGVGKEDACLRAGITRKTLYNWRQEAHENPDDPALQKLLYVLDHAESQYIAALEKRLYQAATGQAPAGVDGRLILNILERRRPSRWATASRGEVLEEPGSEDERIVINFLPAPEEEDE